MEHINNRIVEVICNADLRCSHTGLKLIAKGLKVKLDELKPGQVVVFLNTKKTHMKLFGCMNSFLHFTPENGGKIDMRVIALIPRFFNGKEFDYTKALREILVEELGGKNVTVE